MVCRETRDVESEICVVPLWVISDYSVGLTLNKRVGPDCSYVHSGLSYW